MSVSAFCAAARNGINPDNILVRLRDLNAIQVASLNFDDLYQLYSCLKNEQIKQWRVATPPNLREKETINQLFAAITRKSLEAKDALVSIHKVDKSKLGGRRAKRAKSSATRGKRSKSKRAKSRTQKRSKSRGKSRK